MRNRGVKTSPERSGSLERTGPIVASDEPCWQATDEAPQKRTIPRGEPPPRKMSKTWCRARPDPVRAGSGTTTHRGGSPAPLPSPRVRLVFAPFRSGRSPRLLNNAVVLGMRPDPEPEYSSVDIHADGTMVLTDADRPEPCDSLQMKGGVARIALHQLEVLIGERLNRRR